MNCLRVPKILVPKEGTDLYKWSVVACDQYTSQPEYWKKTEQAVGDAPSTLKLILPEVYLGSGKEEGKIESIHEAMDRYLDDKTLRELPAGFMLVERSFGKKYARNGLVAEIDLETYEYKKGEHSLIRPTEMTVEERIPSRLRVRQAASLELPHIMLLIDDPDCSIIEPLAAGKEQYGKIYDTDLMQKGGHIAGWLIPEGGETDRLMSKIEELANPGAFRKKYNLKEDYPLLNLAVGDGNHSMATAKAAWENIKKDLTEAERESHPARFCLCEIVNVHDKSLEVEPIHRVLFHTDKEELLDAAQTYYKEKGCEVVIEEGKKGEPSGNDDEHSFCYADKAGYGMLRIKKPAWGIAVATLQCFLDEYIARHSGVKIDYIHGTDVAESLGRQEGNIGFLMPEVEKDDLFKGVIIDGVLPRKTFSMGEANEKRYYMECKRIK